MIKAKKHKTPLPEDIDRIIEGLDRMNILGRISDDRTLQKGLERYFGIPGLSQGQKNKLLPKVRDELLRRGMIEKAEKRPAKRAGRAEIKDADYYRRINARVMEREGRIKGKTIIIKLEQKIAVMNKSRTVYRDSKGRFARLPK